MCYIKSFKNLWSTYLCYTSLRAHFCAAGQVVTSWWYADACNCMLLTITCIPVTLWLLDTAFTVSVSKMNVRVFFGFFGRSSVVNALIEFMKVIFGAPCRQASLWLGWVLLPLHTPFVLGYWLSMHGARLHGRFTRWASIKVMHKRF